MFPRRYCPPRFQLRPFVPVSYTHLDVYKRQVLHGAVPEGRFTEADALALFAEMQDGHFPPGAHYSYSNGNFRLLAELIRRATGQDFATLLQERIFRPAKMPTARLVPDTATRIDEVVGYEGNDCLLYTSRCV